MRNFCTLFDKNYLLFGLALHASLLRHHRAPFRLYVLAMDATCEATLRALALEHVVVVGLDDVLTADLGWIRERMSFGQVCWTCQPLLCRHVLDQPDTDQVTYLEADSYFYADPQPLFDEIGSRSVSLVPHHYAPGYDQTTQSGIYCVQFNLFRDDAAGRDFLTAWIQSCLLYDRRQGLWFPGQVCMDTWPLRSGAVCVVQHKGAGVAPWNVSRYEVALRDGAPTVDGQAVIFFHFHQLALMEDGAYYLSMYPLGQPAIDLLYKPYLAELGAQRRMLRTRFADFDHFKTFRSPGLRATFLSFDMKRWRAYRAYLGIRRAGQRNVLRAHEAV